MTGRRERFARRAAPVACALLLAAGLVVGVEARHAAPEEPSARLTACVPTGPRESVADLNRFVASSPGVPGFLGADVGVDVRLGDGRSLWLFADTLRSTASGAGLVRNSMLVFTRDCARLVEPPDRGSAVIPDRKDGVGYWPMSAWSLPTSAGATVYVMSQRVTRVSDEPFGFATFGPALSVFTVPHDGVPELVVQLDLGPDNPFTAAPEWGAAAALEGEWLYLYGTSTRDLPGIHGFALRVARVHPQEVADLPSWRYWDGVRWQPDPQRAVALVDEEGGVSQTLSVWAQDGRWFVLSKQDEFLGTQVVVWPGPGPTGPFGPPQPVAELPCDPASGELRYMPLAHPGLLREPGSVVVSYSRNYVDFQEVCEAPTHYRPYFLRVPLPP